MIHLKLEIENHYEDGEHVTTHAETDVPPPPDPIGHLTDDMNEWEQEYIFPLTGTGKEEGDSAYFVKVIGSSDPVTIPLGTEWEFGL